VARQEFVLRMEHPWSDLPKWRRAIFDAAREAGFAEQDSWDIVSAVCEACSNAVVHGVKGRDGGVTLSVRANDERFEAVVADPGDGFEMPGGAPPATRKPGRGRGIPLMTKLMDEVAFECRPGCRVTLIKRRP
jgi:serine/threonine-protein kinase RsbW